MKFENYSRFQPTARRSLRPAIFFDRDGTLIRDEGYIHRVEDLEWLPGAIEAIRHVRSQGYLAIVITNQSGIARGYFTTSDLHAFHQHMNQSLEPHGTQIDAFYFCPYHEEGLVKEYRVADHPDRKPSPGMIRRALVEWSVEASLSFMIGDQESDVAAGQALGLRSLKVGPGELLRTVKNSIRLDQFRVVAPASETDLRADAVEVRDWLFETLLPFWWKIGFDRQANCFHEQISGEGIPVNMPRRIMVQARQTFSFARAGRFKWLGPWQEAVLSGLDVLLERGIRPDGGTRHSLDDNGQPLDHRRDIYDAAFVILGLSEASLALGGHDTALKAAGQLVEWVRENWSHSSGGYYEGDLADPSLRRQNPHMHLLEALLNLYEATGKSEFVDMATEIVELATNLVEQCRQPAIPEYFDHDLRPFFYGQDMVVEPGHLFEWSYLYHQYHAVGGSEMHTVGDALRVTGEAYGVNLTSGMIHEQISQFGHIITPTSRLWTHCERLKANLTAFETTDGEATARAARQALRCIRSYFHSPDSALAFERRHPDGRFIRENSRASSLYHVVFALTELIRSAGLDG